MSNQWIEPEGNGHEWVVTKICDNWYGKEYRGKPAKFECKYCNVRIRCVSNNVIFRWIPIIKGQESEMLNIPTCNEYKINEALG